MSFDKWRKISLETVCKKITDGSHWSPKSAIKGYPMASVKNLTYYDISIEECRRITKEDYEKLIKNDCKPLNNDVLVAKDGSYLKNIIVISEERDIVVLSSIAILRPDLDKINPYYLKYYLLNPESKNRIKQGYISGSALPRIILKDFKKFEINLTSLKEQEKIASILSSLDDKIKLNNQINKNLEQIAQEIFKHWFIDFEFPNENGDPYKSSGSEMVDCELGLIPKGWEIKKVGEILKTVLGGTPIRKKKIYWENGKIPWINSGKVNEYRIIEPSEYITELGLEKSSTKLLPKRTTVIAITGATLGQISLLEIDCCANQSIVGILENNIFKSEYIYFWMINIIDSLISWQTGGAQQHVNKDNINKVNILIPNEKILQKYYTQVRSIFNKISSNCFENKNLQRLRDLLLPKLISGEIRMSINNVEGDE